MKLCGAIQSKSKGLRKGSCRVNGLSLDLNLETLALGGKMSSGGRRWMSQLKQRPGIWPSATFLFIQTLNGLDDAYTLVKTLVCQYAESNDNLFQRHIQK